MTIPKKYNTRAIVNNIRLVLKTGNMAKLNNPTYKFITLYHGFIAHYNLGGFIQYYDDKILAFRRSLITGEMNYGYDYNVAQAERRASGQFDNDGGREYQENIAETMLEIIKVAREVGG